MQDVRGFRHPIRAPRTSPARLQWQLCQCQRIRLPSSAHQRHSASPYHRPQAYHLHEPQTQLPSPAYRLRVTHAA
ncbi:hypothetical protein BGY98DRAFT_1026579 [Russula aff. rugulosa BPL654]|nr:hypothetical protein BGY98DRAFT_1026579 [Russula aff. rugulosa BPL654]